jgi:hypothetical protein
VWLDELADFWVELGKSAGDAEADRAYLAMNAAAFSNHFHVKLVDQVTVLEGKQNGVLQWDGGEVFFKGATVDDDLTGAFGKPNVCDGVFAAACGRCGSDFAHGIDWERNE